MGLSYHGPTFRNSSCTLALGSANSRMSMAGRNVIRDVGCSTRERFLIILTTQFRLLILRDFACVRPCTFPSFPDPRPRPIDAASESQRDSVFQTKVAAIDCGYLGSRHLQPRVGAAPISDRVQVRCRRPAACGMMACHMKRISLSLQSAAEALLPVTIAIIVLALATLAWEWHSARRSHSKHTRASATMHVNHAP